MPATGKSLNIAFLWHYHQPFYKNSNGLYEMPWIRFHGTKDYLDMLHVMAKYPGVKHTLNLVPSLIWQIQDYVENNARDNVWILANRPANKLNTDEKRAILENFFLANPETMIKPYVRYNELYEKFAPEAPYDTIRERLNRFTTQDFLDLQMWYNMIWIGRVSRGREVVKYLFEKERGFTEADKALLFEELAAIMREIIPLHKKMWDSGQIDISTSPFYHPILPLLIDSDIAKIASPKNPFPDPAYRHAEDAEAQLKEGLAYFKAIFQRKPSGIWPPEGGISSQTVEMIARTKVRWTAANQAILDHSLKSEVQIEQAYQPHLFHGKSRSIHLFFRDEELSNAIAHAYCSWDGEAAAADFISRLHAIRENLLAAINEADLPNYIVPIILDGETCWVNYADGGMAFLQTLFQGLADDPAFKTVTFNEFLDQNPPAPNLYDLYPGSWINSNFDIWIGSEEDNRAWEMLKNARDFLVKQEKRGVLPEEVSKEAWRQIYIAQDSDWCWWYGDEYSSAQDAEFDQLFRSHLMKVYELAGGEIPAALYQTIKQTHFDRFASIRPLNYIHPTLDGEVTHFYEWTGAATYESRKSSQSAMQQISRIIDTFYLGFDKEHFFFRIDFTQPPDLLYEFVIAAKTPKHLNLVYSPLRGVLEMAEIYTSPVKKTLLPPSFCMKKIFEGAVAFADLGLQAGDLFGFQLIVKQNGIQIAAFPHTNIIEVEVPGKDYELKEWSV